MDHLDYGQQFIAKDFKEFIRISDRAENCKTLEKTDKRRRVQTVIKVK